MSHQLNFIYNDSDWVAPSEYPDLRNADEVAIYLKDLAQKYFTMLLMMWDGCLRMVLK